MSFNTLCLEETSRCWSPIKSNFFTLLKSPFLDRSSSSQSLEYAGDGGDFAVAAVVAMDQAGRRQSGAAQSILVQSSRAIRYNSIHMYAQYTWIFICLAKL